MVTRMITVERGFQYSVNLSYDIDNPLRVRTYIPTESFIDLTRDLISSFEPDATNRSRILVGPYGTGKSHLVTVVASLLKQGLAKRDYAFLIEKLRDAGNECLAHAITSLLTEKPFLTVILNPNDGDLRQIFIRGLKRALRDTNLEEIMPKTVFRSIVETLELWQEQFPLTFQRFGEILKGQYRMTMASYMALLDRFEDQAVEMFQAVFPALSAGAKFDVHNTDDIPTMFWEVSSLLRRKGYRGVYVLFDEFNKVLEGAAYRKKPVDLKLLQDFAEMCNRSGETQVHFMLISHQHISQYASVLPEEIMNTWQKVEGRFAAVSVKPGSGKTYQLISTVIKKDVEQWNRYMITHRTAFQRLFELTRTHGLFPDLDDDELEQRILYGCYPLHPSTVFALPKVCNRLAQNERTLFTFLATNDLHTLGRFLEEWQQETFKLLTIDTVFDYFAESALKRRDRDALGRNFLLASEAIARLNCPPDAMAVRILKSLAVIIGLEEPGFVPTAELLKFALVHDSKDEGRFENDLRQLLEAKLIYERKSDGRIQFLTGSDIDFAEAVREVRGNHRYANLFDTCNILNEFFAPYPIIANRYNDEYEMTRFFYQEFFSARELAKGVDWLEYLKGKGYADGVVAYIVCETEEECAALKQCVEQYDNRQVVFVFSHTPLNGLSELVHDYFALHLLKKDKSFLEQDPHAAVELEAYLSDYEERIQLALEPLVDFGSPDQVVYYCTQKVPFVRGRTDMSRLVSKICGEVFGKTPKINNELVNRTNVTTTVANARKKVVQAILSGTNEIQLGLTGYGPAVSIFRSLLRRPRLYREEEGRSRIVLDEHVDGAFAGVIRFIQDTVQKRESRPLSFADLLADLQKPEYGLRLGVLPVFLAIAFRDLKKRLLIRGRDGIELPLDEELLETIVKTPEQFTIELIGLDVVKERYLEQLASLFGGFLPRGKMSHNYAYPVGVAMKKWFVSLPRYTRESRMHSEPARALCRVLSVPMTDSLDLLFHRVPSIVKGTNEFQICDAEIYVELVRKIKEELESHLLVVRTQLAENVKHAFGVPGVSRSLAIIIRDWYAGLSDRTKNYAFSGTAFRVLALARALDREDDRQVLDELVQVAVGLDLEDWSDAVAATFQEELGQAIEVIMAVERDSVPKEHHRVSFMTEDGGLSERVFPKVEVSALGKILFSELASSLDGFADAISIDEKRQILLDLLQNIS